MRFPEIDYDSHPAYSPFRNSVVYDEAFVDAQVRAADLAYARFCAVAEPAEKDADSALAEIRQAAGEIARHATQRNIPVTAEEWLRCCGRWTVADIAYEFGRRIHAAREYRPKALPPDRALQLSAMRDRGMYVASLPAAAYEDIRRLSMAFRDRLAAQARESPSERAVLSTKFNSPLWRAIKTAVHEAGIIDVLSELKQNRMTLLGAGLEYSGSGQNWYQNIYSDMSLPDSPFQYLHFDEGYCLPKAMIYVTPVTDSNGPTRAIPGSNAWDVSEFRLRMHRALDRIVGDRYGQFGASGNYRPTARRPELRNIFMQLPRGIRGSSHFGDDILPGTGVAQALDGLEFQYLSDGGQALVFDGPHLLHRGSLVRNGERMALQVAFRNRNEAIVKARLAGESYVGDQVALARKYARKYVMAYL
jgi:ectoine hydroxylase-related dioxygenase (phytanoyl-CoA dioxygenase family)